MPASFRTLNGIMAVLLDLASLPSMMPYPPGYPNPQYPSPYNLMMAVMDTRYNLVQIILEQGADIEVRDRDGLHQCTVPLASGTTASPDFCWTGEHTRRQWTQTAKDHRTCQQRTGMTRLSSVCWAGGQIWTK